jgi:hypothetical protein
MIRHGQRVAVVAAAAALASFTAGCSLLSSAPTESSRATATHTDGGVRYRDSAFGWTIRHSKHLQVGHFTANGMFTADGAWVANFDVGANGDETRGGRVPDLRRLRTFPPRGVALMIWFGERLPAPPPLRDTRFPVTAGTLHGITPYVGGTEPTPQYRIVYGDGSSFAVAVWIGPHASSQARGSIESTLESLRFPPLRTGTIRANRFYVLHPIQSYPVGSVTHVPASTLPVSHPYFTTRHGFYLVHAPRALYAIPDQFRYPDSNQTCALIYRPPSQRFACPGTHLQWGRDGRPVASSDSNAGYESDWALGLHIATVAHDGHVLYSPFFGALLGLRMKGDPWE